MELSLACLACCGVKDLAVYRFLNGQLGCILVWIVRALSRWWVQCMGKDIVSSVFKRIIAAVRRLS